MEFTKLLKYGSSILFLTLVAHGLILGFSAASTVISVCLAGIVTLFEAQLVKKERDEQEARVTKIITEFHESVNKLSKVQENDKKELMERIANTHSQINAIKLSNGFRKG